MKVFISHSSHDKWVARQMSALLEAAGHTTFLDEKDIKTGDSIDGAIQSHLKDSEHLLILISPASISSHWVFIELGGAKALGKKVIPILFHVGANEIPSAISQLLARDINDFDRYVTEIGIVSKQASPSLKRAKKVTKQPVSATPIVRPAVKGETRLDPAVTEGTFDGLTVGDKVRIVEVQRLTDEEKAVGPKWTPPMDKYSGIDTHVTGFWPGGRFVRLAADEGKFWWCRPWVSKVD